MIYPVFDKKQALYVYKLSELLEMHEQQQLFLRETNKAYVRQIRSYIIENFHDNNVYLPPVVGGGQNVSLEDGKPQQLHIIDGSHRLKALLTIPNVLDKFIYSADAVKSKQGFDLRYAYLDITVAFQVYEGLSEQEMSQLYLDLNTKGKKVALSKLIAYDSRDEINIITNRLLQSNRRLQVAGIEIEKAAVVRPANKNFMSLSQLRNIIGIFITGKDVDSKLSLKMEKYANFEEAYDLANTWLEAIFDMYPPQQIGDYDVSMLASYPLQLALVHYALEGIQKGLLEQKQQHIRQRIERLHHINWQRQQEVWQKFDGRWQGKGNYYYINKHKKNIVALVRWLNTKGGEQHVKET